MNRSVVSSSAAIAAAVLVVSSALAVDVPSSEPFAANSAGWRETDGLTNLVWNAAGGADGLGYVSMNHSFANDLATNPPAVSPPVLMNAFSGWNSSGNVFFGNWIAAGVTGFSFSFRHNVPEPLTVFARFADPANFPGATAIRFAPLPANTWATITFSIDPTSPNFVSFEGSNFANVFDNIGRVQIGVFVSQTLALTTPSYTFDLDNVQLIPTPGAASVLAFAGVLAARRRRSATI